MKYGIAVNSSRLLANKKAAPTISLVTEQEVKNNPDRARIFRLLNKRLLEKDINFDPFNLNESGVSNSVESVK